ncbi:hypothetical protein PVK06_045000 [Gossypium arboreum]|uniref:Uncharacterized protein n=1 Tax=Gossypium arboreum TaxID=29729 RepID=A0ABR0MUJ1_GOSAR|nr:hypothetical protein PVK06_045000 [Gossypium arboreum]
MEHPTPVRHSVSGWDMHLSGSMFDAGNTYWGMTSTSSGWQSTSDWKRCEMSIRRDDVLPTTSTGEGTSYVAHDDRSDDESDADPPREVGPDGAEIALFSEPETVPTIPEDVEGGVVDGSVLDSSLVQLLAAVVVHPVGDLVVGVESLTHLDRIMTVVVFAFPMEEVFEPRKVMGIGRKKSPPMVSPTIPHTTMAYRLVVNSE